MCFKSYSLNKAVFENARNIRQILVKYCSMIVWFISYRSATYSSGTELSFSPFFPFPSLFTSFCLCFLSPVSEEGTQRRSCHAWEHEIRWYLLLMPTSFLKHNTKLSLWGKKTPKLTKEKVKKKNQTTSPSKKKKSKQNPNIQPQTKPKTYLLTQNAMNAGNQLETKAIWTLLSSSWMARFDFHKYQK